MNNPPKSKSSRLTPEGMRCFCDTTFFSRAGIKFIFKYHKEIMAMRQEERGYPLRFDRGYLV